MSVLEEPTTWMIILFLVIIVIGLYIYVTTQMGNTDIVAGFISFLVYWMGGSSGNLAQAEAIPV
jgi:hypothetical protein